MSRLIEFSGDPNVQPGLEATVWIRCSCGGGEGVPAPRTCTEHPAGQGKASQASVGDGCSHGDTQAPAGHGASLLTCAVVFVCVCDRSRRGVGGGGPIRCFQFSCELRKQESSPAAGLCVKQRHAGLD